MPNQLELPLDAPSRAVMRHRASLATQQAADFRRDDFEGLGRYQGRQLGTASGDRPLTAMERMRALRYARSNYKRNGIHKQMISKLVEHTLGDGVKIDGFVDPEVKAYLGRTLFDKRNRFLRRIEERWRETLNEGEYLLCVETDRRGEGRAGDLVPTGLVRFGRFEVEQIVKSLHAEHDADEIVAFTIEHRDRTRVRMPVIGEGRRPARDRRKVNGEEVETGTLTAISYWSINNLGGRGTPKLLTILEKARLVDDVVDENARKAAYLNRFWNHGEYEATGDEEQDTAFEDEALTFMQEGQPGESFITSAQRKFVMKTFAPDLKMLDQQALYELVLDYVLGSEGIPRMWFSSGGDTNRATAVEQGSPIHRTLLALQTRLKEILEDLVEYLIWLGKSSGRISMEADESFEITMSAISTRDTQRDVSVLQQLAATLDLMEAKGYLTHEEAQKLARAAVKAQTTVGSVELGDELPPMPEGGVETILNRVPERFRDPLREALRQGLPLHRAKEPA